MHTITVRLSQNPPSASRNSEKNRNDPGHPNKTNTFRPNNIPFDPSTTRQRPLNDPPTTPDRSRIQPDPISPTRALNSAMNSAKPALARPKSRPNSGEMYFFQAQFRPTLTKYRKLPRPLTHRKPFKAIRKPPETHQNPPVTQPKANSSRELRHQTRTTTPQPSIL